MTKFLFNFFIGLILGFLFPGFWFITLPFAFILGTIFDKLLFEEPKRRHLHKIYDHNGNLLEEYYE